MQTLQDHLLQIRHHLYPQFVAQDQADSAFPAGFGGYNRPLSLSTGIDLFQQGRLEESTSHLADFLHENPENQLAYVYLAFTCAARGLEEDARIFITHAAEIGPLQPAYWAGLGESFLKGGNSKAAVDFLEQAVAGQPDLFAAYPALAEAKRLSGQPSEAIELLESVAAISSASQETILGLLLEWQALAGNITAIVKLCSRLRANPAYQALGIALAPRTNLPPAQLAEAVNDFLQDSPRVSEIPAQPQTPLTIAFLASDCHREAMSNRLESLLLNLPPERFKTIVLWNDLRQDDETIQRSCLMSDRVFAIGDSDDPSVLAQLAPLQIQVLIDLDGLGVQHRLPLFLAAPVPVKLSWSDTAVPLLTRIPCLQGAALWPEPVSQHPYGLHLLPGTGECPAFSDTPVSDRDTSTPFTFACLCSPQQYDEDSWKAYAELLAQTSATQLLINLGESGEDARRFISSHFEQRGVSPGRLAFIHALTPETLAEAWNQADLGLAPLHGPGDMALSLALWMEKPYLAIADQAPWSRRPAALLRATELECCIAQSPAEWLALGQQFANSGRSSRIQGLRQSIQNNGLTGRAEDFALAFAELLEQLHQKAC